MPRPLLYVGLVLTALSLLPLGWLVLERSRPSTHPRLQVVPDMDTQPKYRAQSPGAFFADGRAMRLPVEGTVARDGLREDEHLYAGRIEGTEGTEGAWATAFPVPVNGALLDRGRERFGIYCSPCHGLAGRGDGMVHQRAVKLAEGTWTPPSDLSSDAIAAQSVGQIFDTISHGVRNMPSYAAQIPVIDRWAIVAYVRALQRSVRGTLEDADPEGRRELEASSPSPSPGGGRR